MAIPPGRCLSISQDPQSLPGPVYSIRIHEELAQKLMDSSSNAKLVFTRQAATLIVDGIEYEVTRAREAQAVDIIRVSNNGDDANQATAELVGSVREKLLVKPQLVAAHRERVRLHTQLAEQQRHSRHTISLNEEGKSSYQAQTPAKRAISRITHSKSVKLHKPMGLNKSIDETIGRTSRSAPSLPPTRVVVAKSEIESYESWSTSDDKLSPMLPLRLHSTPQATTTTSSSLPSAAIPHSLSLDTIMIPSSSTRTVRTSTQPKLLSTRINSACDTETSVARKLAEELRRREQEVEQLTLWVQQRESLTKQLTGEASSDDPETSRAASFRLVIERERLKADSEYQERVMRVEEGKAAIALLQHRLHTLVLPTDDSLRDDL